jgi:AcrR family transcriptional regulator
VVERARWEVEEEHMAEQRSRRKRGSLSAEQIIDAALSILDHEGESALTFARLGEELQAAPTAVYRHFASREHLITAIADHLDGISLAGYVPTDDWRADLDNLAWRAWRTAVAHPAAAAISLNLITNGMNELRAVDAVLRALHHAGFSGTEAVLQYQVYATMVLGAAAANGGRLAALDGKRASGGWVQVYAPVNPVDYPYAEALKSELRLVDYEVVFATQITMYLDALALVAANASVGSAAAVSEPLS